MKKLKFWLKFLLNKETWLSFGYIFIDSFGWCRSLILYIFKSVKYPGIFYGYCSYYWALKYAERRTICWDKEWDQNGKQQGVFPFAEIKLLVCSKLELEFYKKKGLLDKKAKPRKMIQKSYYKTTL